MDLIGRQLENYRIDALLGQGEWALFIRLLM
jgi:hypothetical protein